VAIAIQQSTLFEQAQTELAERKRAEEKLREQAAPQCCNRRDSRSRSREQNLIWNRGAEHLYGWKEDDKGKNASELLKKAAST